MKIITNSFLLKFFPKEVQAVTVYPFIHLRNLNNDPILLNHERIHILQIQKIGAFKFYFDYILQYLKNRIAGQKHHDAYLNISYEKEAYSNQHNLRYSNGDS